MARQRLVHGATIDAATPEEIARIVAGALDARAVADYQRKKGTVDLDATGAGTVYVPVSAQYDWILERVTATAAAGAQVLLYENQPNNSDLLEAITMPASGNYSDGFANRIYVPSNSRLLVVVTAGGANGQATFNIQVQQLHRPRKP